MTLWCSSRSPDLTLQRSMSSLLRLSEYATIDRRKHEDLITCGALKLLLRFIVDGAHVDLFETKDFLVYILERAVGGTTIAVPHELSCLLCQFVAQ